MVIAAVGISRLVRGVFPCMELGGLRARPVQSYRAQWRGTGNAALALGYGGMRIPCRMDLGAPRRGTTPARGHRARATEAGGKSAPARVAGSDRTAFPVQH